MLPDQEEVGVLGGSADSVAFGRSFADCPPDEFCLPGLPVGQGLLQSAGVRRLAAVKRALNFPGVSVLLLLASSQGFSQGILPLDPQQPIGRRPYEMVWAERTESEPPTISFDQLSGWKVQVENGAQATLQVTRAQNLWNRPVARLRYRGEGGKEAHPRIFLVPARPISLPAGADSVDAWLYGNRWGWENPPDTPATAILLHLIDERGVAHELHLDEVRWQEWWLMHRKLPAAWSGRLQLQSVEIAAGWQPDWRELFLDSIRFYREPLPALSVARRPRRNLRPAAGQSPGANLGPGRLPFPTRPSTILPAQFEPGYHNGVTEAGSGHWSWDYRGKDASIAYTFQPARGLSSLQAWFNGQPAARLLEGAELTIPDHSPDTGLVSAQRQGRGLVARYADGTCLRLSIQQKSLIIDVSNLSGKVSEFNFGKLTGLSEPHTIAIPYLTYGGGSRPCVLLSRAGTNHVFTSIWLDWYRSNGSEPYAAESAAGETAGINGGVRYLLRTDGTRNPLFERLVITVSARFEETLPTVPNPVGLHAKEATDRLWQESWGPDDYQKQMARSRRLRAYGIEKLIQCNHEIVWRDGGESFTLRTRAAPNKGGDAALEQYVAHQRALGWLVGLYSNYTDYAPVNEFWSPDGVQRQPDGNWRSAWPRCWAEKPLTAVEFDARLAPQIKAKFHPNSAYTDVQTAVAPWNYTDYDARVPGAGTFAQTFYAYGELLRNDSRVYDGPIFSEGTYQWLYAGLADGNYALAYDGHPLAKEPLMPAFDLLQIHPKECDIGMGWTANFCDAIAGWRQPSRLDQAIDRFLLHTLAYGHIGWLVEEEHGMSRTCRSYYMLQQVQARYGLKAPSRIAYWDGARLVSLSEALVQDLPRSRRQMYIEYPGGLGLWLNDHPTEDWRIDPRAQFSRSGSNGPKPFLAGVLDLPPAGWAALSSDGTIESFSALVGTNRADYIRSPEYTYLDGRGVWFEAPEAASDGGLAIRPVGRHELKLTHISGAAPFVVRRSYQIQGVCSSCQAYDADGKVLPNPDWEEIATGVRISPRQSAVTYLLRFTRTRAASGKPPSAPVHALVARPGG